MFYTLMRLIAKGFFWLWGNPTIVGRANIPDSGPLILVANHTSLLDGFLLAAFWPHRLTFLSAAYLFKMPVVSTLLRGVGAIPVQNQAGDLSGIRTALQVLRSGGVLALFPEGHVGTGGNLGSFQTGWAYLALKAGAPVVPVAIKGTERILPMGASFPRRSRIYVQIGAPLVLERAQRPRQQTLAALNLTLVSRMEQMLNGI